MTGGFSWAVGGMRGRAASRRRVCHGLVAVVLGWAPPEVRLACEKGHGAAASGSDGVLAEDVVEDALRRGRPALPGGPGPPGKLLAGDPRRDARLYLGSGRVHRE